jgi:hypothetical protein
VTQPNLIDVWSIKTFDDVLIGTLRAQAALIEAYFVTDHVLFLERESSDHRGLPPSNEHAEAFLAFVEMLGQELESRTIRAWHYARLTDGEVERIRSRGTGTSALSTLKERLEQLVATGSISSEMADLIFTGSPFHDDPMGSRAGKFWAVSHPLPVSDAGVKDLLQYWGGESAYFWQKNGSVLAHLANLGRARVLELAAPLMMTKHAYPAARAVVSTFARSIGAPGNFGMFDLYVINALRPQAILKIHNESDPSFYRIGIDYPADIPRDAHSD